MHFCLPHLPFVDVRHSDPHNWKDLMLYELQILIRIISEVFCHGRERRNGLEDLLTTAATTTATNNKNKVVE